MTRKQKKRKLPDFTKMSYEEEARWWDTHSLADYEDEFEEVDLKLEPGAARAPDKYRELSRMLAAENLESAIRVRLTKQARSRLKVIAGQKGMGIATLVRMWIMEKLQERGRKEVLRY